MHSEVLILILVAVVSVASLIFGSYLSKESSSSKLSDEDTDRAFNEAKAKYLEYFHKRYDPKYESLLKALMEENANLKQELWKERNKNK
jgi:ABC-type cobalt transport system substrate-binding protein